MLPRTRSLIAQRALLVLLMLSAACASLPIKERLVKSAQATETALGAAQDFERSAFMSGAIPSLTPAKHQAISAAFSNAFGTQIKLATALRAWRSGDPKPASVDQLAADVRETLAVIQQATAGGTTTGPASELIGKVNAILAEVAKVADAFGGKS